MYLAYYDVQYTLRIWIVNLFTLFVCEESMLEINRVINTHYTNM